MNQCPMNCGQEAGSVTASQQAGCRVPPYLSREQPKANVSGQRQHCRSSCPGHPQGLAAYAPPSVP